MQKTILFKLILVILGFVGLTACEHQIDFDFPTAESVVVFDGRISNEDVFVRISKTRPMSDTSKEQFVSNAQVWIASDDGNEEQLVYNEREKCYQSATGLVGIPGHTYQMRATVDGRDYFASSTMQQPALIDTVYFRWLKVLNERIYFYCLKGTDAIPNERNYYVCRLMRGNEVFRWNPRSGRSSVNGAFEYDIICSNESAMEKGIDDDGKIPLMDGDTIRMELMSIDRTSWLFFQSLVISQSTTANPITNIEGGAQGVFIAANISRGDTLVFNKQEVLKHKEEK